MARTRLVKGENDLATLHPDLAAEWDYERNAPLTPQDVTVGSGKKVFWLCAKGHSWKASIKSRNEGSGCPYCSGRFPISGETDLATLRPDLAAEWDNERNAPLTPQDVSPGSERKVFWRCEKGHSWQASINHRNHGSGCPYCVREKKKGSD